jgi:hypothetical protein
MSKGTKIAGWDSPIITSRPKWSNFHIADRNGRAYLCNCCKRIKLSKEPIYGFTQKGIKRIKLL